MRDISEAFDHLYIIRYKFAKTACCIYRDIMKFIKSISLIPYNAMVIFPMLRKSHVAYKGTF